LSPEENVKNIDLEAPASKVPKELKYWTEERRKQLRSSIGEMLAKKYSLEVEDLSSPGEPPLQAASETIKRKSDTQILKLAPLRRSQRITMVRQSLQVNGQKKQIAESQEIASKLLRKSMNDVVIDVIEEEN
jgi:hypothetical protein